jgi:hypothetical protein
MLPQLGELASFFQKRKDVRDGPTMRTSVTFTREDKLLRSQGGY